MLFKFYRTAIFGNKLYSVNEKPLKEVLADVPFITDQLTIDEVYECFVLQRLTVINISRRYHKVEKLSFFIANQVQFETEEPTHRAFPSLGYTLENFVNMYSLVPADAQGCTVDKAYARAFSQQNFLDKQG